MKPIKMKQVQSRYFWFYLYFDKIRKTLETFILVFTSNVSLPREKYKSKLYEITISIVIYNNRHLYPLFTTFTNNDILVYKFCSHLVAFCVPWVFVWDNLWYRQIYVLILQWVQTQTDIDCMVFLQMLVTKFCHKWRKNAQLNTCNTDISIKTPKIAPIKLHSRLATDNGWGKQYLNQKPEDLQNHFHTLHFTLAMSPVLLMSIKANYFLLNSL